MELLSAWLAADGFLVFQISTEVSTEMQSQRSEAWLVKTQVSNVKTPMSATAANDNIRTYPLRTDLSRPPQSLRWPNLPAEVPYDLTEIRDAGKDVS